MKNKKPIEVHAHDRGSRIALYHANGRGTQLNKKFLLRTTRDLKAPWLLILLICCCTHAKHLLAGVEEEEEEEEWH